MENLAPSFQVKMSTKESCLEIIEKRLGANVKKSVPRVSIIIPAYNVAGLVAETLDSIKSQTFNDYEIILVNDGSTDTEELETVLEPYYEDIVYIKQNNSGTAEARNTAIKAARGDILAFLDGDDIWLPSYLESQIGFLESNKLDMVYCDAILFGENFDETETFMKRAPSSGKFTAERLLKAECNVITSGTICTKQVLLKHGLFDKNAVRMEDIDLWFRLAKNNVNIGYQRNVLLKYRIRKGSLSGTDVQRAERSVKALELMGSKYELNDFEQEIWRDELKKRKAYLHLEKGKSYLLKNNFDKAVYNFKEANKLYRRLKLSAVILLLKIHPELVLKLFKKFRLYTFTRMETNDTSD